MVQRLAVRIGNDIAGRIPTDLPRVTVVGLGSTAAAIAGSLAGVGHRVVVSDLDPGRLAARLSGRVPDDEPGMVAMIDEGVQSGLLRACNGAAEGVAVTDVTILAPDITNRQAGQDGRALVAALAAIGDGLRRQRGFHVVIMLGHASPGTAMRVVVPELERASGRLFGTDFGLALIPVVLRPGTVPADLWRSRGLAIGVDGPRTAEIVAELFAPFDAAPAIVSLAQAERMRPVFETGDQPRLQSSPTAAVWQAAVKLTRGGRARDRWASGAGDWQPAAADAAFARNREDGSLAARRPQQKADLGRVLVGRRLPLPPIAAAGGRGGGRSGGTAPPCPPVPRDAAILAVAAAAKAWRPERVGIIGLPDGGRLDHPIVDLVAELCRDAIAVAIHDPARPDILFRRPTRSADLSLQAFADCLNGMIVASASLFLRRSDILIVARDEAGFAASSAAAELPLVDARHLADPFP